MARNNSKTKKRRNNQSVAAKRFNDATKDMQRANFQDAAADKESAKGDKFGIRKVRSTRNAPDWYYYDETVLKDVASFSFNAPLGDRISMSKMFPNNGNSQAGCSIPGLMTLTVAPCAGVSIDAQSPLNIAAQKLYSQVRYKNSGAANYDPTDLMLYILAMDSLYSAWNWMQRIYGCASDYNPMNKYKARAYAAANYVDLDDIYNNLSDFRAFLNMATNKIQSFCVPATMTLNIRHSWLFSNIFKDSDTTKAQEYMYVPAYFYVYDETSSPKGGILKPLNITLTRPSKNYTFADLKNILNTMINALQYSSDIGNMSGDILKEFGSNLFTLSPILPEYRVEAVYNEEVLTQFENAQYYPIPDNITKSLATFTISQDPDTNFLKFRPRVTFDVGEPSPADGNFLNFHKNNPTPQDVMVASRINYVSHYTPPTGKDAKIEILDSLGTEFAVRCTVWLYCESLDPSLQSTGTTQLTLQCVDLASVLLGKPSPNATDWKNIYYCMLAQTAFDWCPQSYLSWYQPAGTNNLVLPSFRDWDVYAYIDNDDVSAMNSLAVMSELGVGRN